MPQINILNVLQGDNQSTIVDKINYNFDQILSAGGGPQGQQGLIGPTGPIGPQGPQGTQGLQGSSGTKWFVQGTTQPSIGNIAGNNPALFPTVGDYWLDTDSSSQEIWVYTPTGWVDTALGLAQGSVFQNVPGILTPGGIYKKAILIASDPNDKGVILSDNTIASYNSNENTNFEDSKLKLSTRDNRKNLVTFSRSDFDISIGGSGATFSAWNPRIEWDEVTSSPANKYFNITLRNPTGSIGIRSEGNTVAGGVNIFANAEVSAYSNNSNVYLYTRGGTSGVFSKVQTPGYGFFEVSDIAVSGNQSNAAFFVNNTGAGIGVGTGGFKTVGLDSRRLAVLGNASFSKNTTGHTGGVFVGSGINYRGSLFADGYAAFGATSPDGGFHGFNMTGMNGLANLSPQLFITSPQVGPVLQVKSNAGQSTNYAGRTTIGDATVEALNWVSPFTRNNTGAGIATDISQELFLNGPLAVVPSGANPTYLSYRQKVSDSTYTDHDIFGIQTSLNFGPALTPVTAVKQTKIETKNNNPILKLESNGLNKDINKLFLGTNEFTSIGIHGEASSPSRASTTIGESGSFWRGLTSGVPSSMVNFTSPLLAGDTTTIRSNTHALVVAGVQTIGTTDPISIFSNTANVGSYAGAASMLKVHRNLNTTPANNPNGIEISSNFNNIGSVTPSANGSLAIVVGSRNNVLAYGDIGFSVSNDGKRIGVNSAPYGLVNLYISADTAGATAIQTDGKIIGERLQMTNSPSPGYIMTSDAVGVGTWTSPSGVGAVPTGAMFDWPLATAPSGYLVCDGSTYPIASYPALYAILGTTFNLLPPGVPAGHFAVPNFKRRVSLGYDPAGGNDPNFTDGGYVAAASSAKDNTGRIGAMGGEAVHKLKKEELASHFHNTDYYTASYIGTQIYNNKKSGDDQGLYQVGTGTGNAGNDWFHENRMPYIVMNKIIKT